MKAPHPSELPEHPPCPHCRSEETELMHTFGSILANVQYYCKGCRCPFEFVKWRDTAP
ncbi:MAG: hypothetical protein R3185_03005 [Candidatus Thermoplasmatota archaeon]|nr:hypothetical protein [Candidatus Thermoplasmatota archaeon]